MLYRINPGMNAVDFKGQTPLHTAAACWAGEAVMNELISKGGMILYGKCSFREHVDRYGLSDKAFRQNPDRNGWINDDVYQVWVKCPHEGDYPCFGSDVRADGVNRIVRELGLSGAPDSAISRTMGWICDNIEIVCVRSHEKQSLVRISAPNLRGLVKEYDKMKVPSKSNNRVPLGERSQE
jgi:ankyrin repeat protein